ncbi:MAG: hypothetical protein ACLVFG_05470 [Lachnospiraceae bacterium]
MESHKKGLDREMIVVCGLVALLVTISIIFSVALWMEIDLSTNHESLSQPIMKIGY